MSMLGTLGLGAVVTAKDRASRTFDNINRSFVNLQRQANTSLSSVERRMEQLNNQMDRARRGMTGSLKMMGAGMVLATPLALATKAAATYEDSMNDVLSVVVGTGVAEGEARQLVKELGDEILAFAGKTRIPLDQVAASAYELTSALGIETAKGAFQSAANQAVAGKGTISESTRVMTSVLANFGLRWGAEMTEIAKSEKVFNIVSGTIAAFNTDLSRLSAGMVYAVPSANLLGMEFSEMAAVLGMLQTKGLEASMSGTAFAAGIRGLTQMTMKFGSETEKAKVEAMEMGDYLDYFEDQRKKGKVSKRIKAAGKLAQLEITDDAGRLLPFWRILQNIEKTFGITAEKSEEAKEAIVAGGLEGADAFRALGLSMTDATSMQAVFRDEGSRAFALLMGQSEKLREYTKQIENSDAGLKMLNARQKGTTAQFEMLTNKGKATSIMFGSILLPGVESMIMGLDSMLVSIQGLIKEYPTATKWIAWGTAILSVLLTVGGAIGALAFGYMMLRTQMALTQLVGGNSVGLFGSLANSTVILRVRLLALAASQGIVTAATAVWATATGLASGALGFLNAMLAATPIGWIILGIVALVAALYMLIFHFDWVKKTATSAFEGINDALRWVWIKLQAFGESFDKLWKNIGSAIMDSPVGVVISAWVDSIMWILDALGLIDKDATGKQGGDLADREAGGPTIQPGSNLMPATLQSGAQILAPAPIAAAEPTVSTDDIWDLKNAPMPDEIEASVGNVIQHNTIHVNGSDKSPERIARAIDKQLKKRAVRKPSGKR